MDRVGIYQAKARLSELIERVERGEEVTITKNRKPVARSRLRAYHSIPD